MLKMILLEMKSKDVSNKYKGGFDMFNFKKGINDFSSIMLLQQKQTGGSIYYSEEKIKSINWDEHDHWIDISFIED